MHQYFEIMMSFIAVSMILNNAIKLNGLLRGLKMTHQTDHAALRHVRWEDKTQQQAKVGGQESACWKE